MITVNRNGKSFHVDEGAHRDWWLNTYPIWEHSTSRFMDERCSKEKITIDIGSWNGVHAMYMAQISKKVYTLEPDPTALRILQNNLACNPDLTNIEALPIALSDKDGFVKIMNAGGSGSSILQSVQEKYSGIPTAETVCMTFRSFLNRYRIDPTEIGFIKIDVEGAEGVCVPDMEWFLKDYQGAISLSLHPGMATDAALENVVQIMSKYFTEVQPECWIRR